MAAVERRPCCFDVTPQHDTLCYERQTVAGELQKLTLSAHYFVSVSKQLLVSMLGHHAALPLSQKEDSCGKPQVAKLCAARELHISTPAPCFEVRPTVALCTKIP